MNTICSRIEVCNPRRDTVMWCGCWNHHLCTACPLIKNYLDAKSYSDRARSRALWRFSLAPGQPDTTSWWWSDSAGSRTMYHNGLWWPPGPLGSFPMTGTPERLCRFHHHKKATGLPHAGLLLPDIWLAFQIFHLWLLFFTDQAL